MVLQKHAHLIAMYIDKCHASSSVSGRSDLQLEVKDKFGSRATKVRGVLQTLLEPVEETKL